MTFLMTLSEKHGMLVINIHFSIQQEKKSKYTYIANYVNNYHTRENLMIVLQKLSIPFFIDVLIWNFITIYAKLM